MRWIGLSGGIASGKSTVCEFLKELGVPIVDADQLARAVVERGTPGLKEVVQAFGPKVLHQDGTLNRAALGEIIFQNESQRETLEQIVHPRIRTMVQQERLRLEKLGHAVAVYDVPLLFEKNMQADFDAIVVVSSSYQNQIQRLMKRNQLTEEQAQLRLSAQMNLSEKVKQADFVIENDGDSSSLKQKTQKLLSQLLSLKKSN